MKFVFFFTALFLLICLFHVTENKVKVGYFPNWTRWRAGKGKYGVKDIAADSVTHIVYAFLNFGADGSLEVPTNVQEDFRDLKDLKSKNPNVKIILSVGGWKAGPDGKNGQSNFLTIAKSESLTKKFAQNALKLVKENGFDGFDIDWEYPAASTKQIYLGMLKEFKNTFGSLELTAAVPASSSKLNDGYDLATLKNYLDYFFVMAYDFHGKWERKTGVNAPMKSNDRLDVESAMQYFISKGVPKDQIVMGLATYGRTWTSQSGDLGSPATGGGTQGQYTKEPGSLAYYEIMDNAWPERWDDLSKTPYASQGNQFVSYDNKASFEIKADYVCQNNLAGIMVWDMAQDSKDRSSAIWPHVGEYMDRGCSGGGGSTTRNPGTTSTTTRATARPNTPTTPVTPSGGSCDTNPYGSFCLPGDCTKYIQCSGQMKYEMSCPASLFFNPSISGCDWNCGC